jgi:hypothetical protein
VFEVEQLSQIYSPASAEAPLLPVARREAPDLAALVKASKRSPTARWSSAGCFSAVISLVQLTTAAAVILEGTPKSDLMLYQQYSIAYPVSRCSNESSSSVPTAIVPTEKLRACKALHRSNLNAYCVRQREHTTTKMLSRTVAALVLCVAVAAAWEFPYWKIQVGVEASIHHLFASAQCTACVYLCTYVLFQA